MTEKLDISNCIPTKMLLFSTVTSAQEDPFKEYATL